MMQALSGFPGALYPVNTRGGVIGARAVSSTVQGIGQPIDLAVLVVPPTAVPGALEDCGRAGVRAAVVCAGGFAESGPEGAALQSRVADVAAQHGISLLGPNTSGFVNPAGRVLANFMPAVTQLTAGPAAIVAQSGGVNLALCFLLAAEGLGVRLGVGLGNAADVGFADVLDHLASDDGARVVGLHLEGVSDGRALFEAVERLSPIKPVVALKVGRADVADFARSHTGALAGGFALTRAALGQAGAVVVDDPTEFVDAMRALGARRMTPCERPGIGIVTGQAGPGLIIADALSAAAVSLPPLCEATAARLRQLLPPLTYQRNPVDTGRPTDSFAEVLSAVAADPAVDALAVYALDEPGALDPVAVLREAGELPVLFGSGGPASTLDSHRAALAELGIPLFGSPDRLAHAVRALAADASARHRIGTSAKATRLGSAGLRLGPAPLDEDGAKLLLAAAGLPSPDRWCCATRQDAHDAFAALGAPVVVKVLDAAVAHKSDVGGVHTGVRTPGDLADALDAIDRIAEKFGHEPRYLVEKQAPPGVDLILGGLRDAAFGPVVLLAAGGVAVEVAPDPVLRLAPLDRVDAVAMVHALPSRLLAGHRGADPVDIAAVAEALLAVAQLLADYPGISELDINPLRLTKSGPIVLDALIVLAKEEVHE